MYPNEPYTLNYLAYSWLERNYKIDEAIDMIQKHTNKKKMIHILLTLLDGDITSLEIMSMLKSI